ncbi:MAG: hypothetical protein COU08_01470 [Candidatus Harrisonbacteria bacterium CG10_big_fil_rev_8_21_14_0_10_42_17]|uniref:Uncharacterized protein n=1 Tax=Candidatus Harrisonbacteria bacterium CG10_big_fil_rev_8_21_14_0_10_42_17 TaxID=1974584 RepID=A0A2M6WIM2_9BACT|nr:MAG: hypothetical protein COU08_01470 [Candidatus Harrisonbacteria bacterium CG10_big_fil_rev_8_21_14_0_10_42_17]
MAMPKEIVSFLWCYPKRKREIYLELMDIFPCPERDEVRVVNRDDALRELRLRLERIPTLTNPEQEAVRAEILRIEGLDP